MSDNPLDALASAVACARDAWSWDDEPSAAALVNVNDLLGRARRLFDAAFAQVATEIARQSRPELGPDSLAKMQGFRSPAAFIAATTGTTNGEAARLLRVGEATAPRATFGDSPAPPRYPHVAAALADGSVGAAASAAIITMLDRVCVRAGKEATDAAEQALAAQAPGLTLDQLSRVIARAEALLDPAGVERREDELRAERYLHIREDHTGMIILNAKLDPEHGAPIKNAIEGLVTAELRAARDERGDGLPEATQRTIPQMQADALARLCEHAIGCSTRDLPLEGATVVVRVALDDLIEGSDGSDGSDGTGFATVDGLATPISIATARRMAAGGAVIPCVLGGDSEILDWGREKRLFTRAQRLALVERDGGCAMCGAPPGHVKVHHIKWWQRDSGPTDLNNGILLCEACHHRIHDNGWDITIDGVGVDAQVWFHPPAQVDPARTPRLGGRRRFDYAA
jgi:hypothetical protein